jgi:hypothetical protein
MSDEQHNTKKQNNLSHAKKVNFTLDLKSEDTKNFLTGQTPFFPSDKISGGMRRARSVAFSNFKRIWYRLAELTQDKTALQACARTCVCTRVTFPF